MSRGALHGRRHLHGGNRGSAADGPGVKPPATSCQTAADAGHDSTRARGPHRIFLGYAVGVGKTYTMLVEARLRASRGEDVAVGYLEPHTRSDTLALIDGLDCIPLKKISYRGREFTELDTNAVIARNPQWVLVDELAHTNIPGEGHEKRWQSVVEMLDAGIGVLSTLNVQHVQRLNDYVYQVAGVRVVETVPDEIVDAGEIVVVDSDPDDLLARVRSGTVLPTDEVGQALTHFFRRVTLVALRDQALAIGRRSSGDASSAAGGA